MGVIFSACAWRKRVIAAERELANERIDLAQRQRQRRPTFQISAEEAIGGHGEIEGGLGGIFDDGRLVLLRECEDAQDAADPGRALMLMNVIADRADRGAGVMGGSVQRDRLRGTPTRAVGVLDAMPAARCEAMLAEQLTGGRVEEADVEVVPLHRDAAADPAGRRAVVRGINLDAPIEMDRPHTEAVIAKRLERQRLQRRLLLGKHRGDLALRGTVDPRIGPACVPVIEIGVAFLDRLEAHPLQWCLLRVAHPPDSTFPLRSGSPTRHGSATTPKSARTSR